MTFTVVTSATTHTAGLRGGGRRRGWVGRGQRQRDLGAGLPQAEADQGPQEGRGKHDRGQGQEG